MAIYQAIENSGARRRLELRSPVDLQPFGEIECASTEDVQAAVARARILFGCSTPNRAFQQNESERKRRVVKE